MRACSRCLLETEHPCTLAVDDLSNRRTLVGDDLEKVAVGIEEVDAIVIAPVDGRVMRDPALREQTARGLEVFAGDLECVMRLAERVGDEVESALWPIGLQEERAGPAVILHQDLIGEAHLNRHPEDVGTEPLDGRTGSIPGWLVGAGKLLCEAGRGRRQRTSGRGICNWCIGPSHVTAAPRYALTMYSSAHAAAFRAAGWGSSRARVSAGTAAGS